MSDIVAFLTARLDEDEQAALAAAAFYDNEPQDVSWRAEEGLNQNGFTNVWLVPHLGVIYDPASGHHIVRHSPARVLREVAAKRAIIADYQLVMANKMIEAATQPDEAKDAARDLIAKTLLMVLRRMAAPYADRDGYNPAWRVE